MASTDFILFGEAEDAEDGTVDVRFALLPSLSNHRRCLLKPVVLTSNNVKVTDFITAIVAEEAANKLDAERAKLPAASRLGAQRVVPMRTQLTSNNNNLTDFVCFISAEEELARLDAERGKLPAVERLGVERVLPKRLPLTSNSTGATDFFFLPNLYDDETPYYWDPASENMPHHGWMKDEAKDISPPRGTIQPSDPMNLPPGEYESSLPEKTQASWFPKSPSSVVTSASLEEPSEMELKDAKQDERTSANSVLQAVLA